jgi:D-3-phosphoglycerate dehydrogenase
MSDLTLAAWGEFLRPSFGDVIEAAGITIVRVGPDEFPADVAPEADALYVRLPRYASAEVIDSLPNLRALSVPGAGIEVIDIDAATRRKIPVLSGRGMGHDAVADWTVGSIVWLVRRMGAMHVAQVTGDWKKRFDIGERRDMNRLTIGVVGYGFIGARVAEILVKGFHSRVLVHDNNEHAQAAATAAGLPLVDLPELLRESDVVTLHTQALHGAPPLIGRAELDLMPPSAVLVNTGRGALLDYPAIMAALDEGRLAGAGLDVFDQEPPLQELIDRLTAHPNVLVSPHQAGMTIDANDSLAVGVASSVVEALQGGRPANAANPEIWE